MAYRSRTFPSVVNNVTGDELDLLDASSAPNLPEGLTATTAWNAVSRLAYGTINLLNATAATYTLTGLTPAAGNLFPANVLVTGCWYQIDTTLTSAGPDAATLNLKLGGSDIIAATAISAGGNIWDAGTHGVSLSAPISVAAASNLTLTTAVQTITSNSTIKFFVEYVVTT